MSMTRDQLLRCLEDPSLLNERTLGELREILDEYPYFQTAHLLYVRNLQRENNFRFAAQLKTCAVFATDRTVLYHLLNPAPEKKRIPDPSLEIDVVSIRDNTASIELSDDPTATIKAHGEPFTRVKDTAGKEHADLLNFELSDTTYMLGGIENETEKPQPDLAKDSSQEVTRKEKLNEPEQKANLIDRFIKDNPAFNVKQSESSGITEKINKMLDNNGESDEYITETLARIYVKQGLYQKAITAFQKLSLKYPEKSVYFARQIEEVTNLLNK